MKQIELTIGKSFKVLWSFLWRGWILMFPVMIVAMILMYSFMPFPKPGEVPKPPEFKDFPIFFLIWLVMMVGGAFVQAIAMRWALKTKWSNFELVAVSTKEDESVKP